MIDFNPISIFEVQSAPATLSCLFLQEFGFDATQEVVLAEPLAPVQEISIIGASRSLDFDMALDMRLRVIPQRGFSVGNIQPLPSSTCQYLLATQRLPLFGCRYLAQCWSWRKRTYSQ